MHEMKVTMLDWKACVSMQRNVSVQTSKFNTTVKKLHQLIGHMAEARLDFETMANFSTSLVWETLNIGFPLDP